MPSSPRSEPSSTVANHRKNVLRQLFDKRNGFVKRSDRYLDFVLEDFECLLEDELSIDGDESGVSVPPFVVRFSLSSPQTHFAVADEDGKIRILDATKSASKACIKEFDAHNNAIFDVAWFPTEPGLLISASGDQTLALWDVASALKVSTFRGHSSSVKTVSICGSTPDIFASGGRDGAIRVWDKRCDGRRGAATAVATAAAAAEEHQARHAVGNAHVSLTNQTTPRRKKKYRLACGTSASPGQPGGGGDSQWSVTSVLFQGDNHLISSGAKDGTIKVWDLRQLYQTSGFVLRGKVDPTPAHVLSYAGSSRRVHGYTSLVIDSTSSRLFASCTDDIIYAYHLTSYGHEPFARYYGHDNKTFYVKAALSPDDNYLVSGSGDNKAYIWNVKRPDLDPIKLKGHTGEVSSVDWCPRDPHLLVTASDDNSVRIWRVNRRGDAAPEPGVVSGVAKREPVEKPVFSLAPRTPGGSSVASGALSPFPRTPTTPRSSAHPQTPRTPGSSSSLGFSPRSSHSNNNNNNHHHGHQQLQQQHQQHNNLQKTPTSASSRDFYSPTRTPQSPSRNTNANNNNNNNNKTPMSPLASFFSPRSLHYGTHTPVTPAQTPRTRRRSAALKGLPSRKLVHGSPSIHQWLQRLSPCVKNSNSSANSSSTTAVSATTDAAEACGSSGIVGANGGCGNKSFDSHPFNLAGAGVAATSSSAVSTSGFVVGSPIKVSPRKLSIKSPTRSPLRLPLSPNVHQNRISEAQGSSPLRLQGVSPLRAQQQRQQQQTLSPLRLEQEQQRRYQLLKRKRSFSSDDDEEDGGENALPSLKMMRRSGGGGGAMRAKKKVFNDLVEERIADKNNGNSAGNGAAASLDDVLPRNWRLKQDGGREIAGTSGIQREQPQPHPEPQLPFPQQQQQQQPLQQPVNLDQRLLVEASPMSAAAETTPTRPTTTPRSRRIGVGGSGMSGKRVSSSTQKCIKFNQEPSGNQTILKYFSKKN